MSATKMNTVFLDKEEENDFVTVPPLHINRAVASRKKKAEADANSRSEFASGVLPVAKLHPAEMDAEEEGANQLGGFDFGVSPAAKLHIMDEEEAEAVSIAEEETGEVVEPVAESPLRIRKVFKIIFFVCVIFLVGELAWLFLVTPMRPLSSVSVTGLNGTLIEGTLISGFSIERNEVLQRAGIGRGTSYLTFDVKAAERNLCAVPFVESAKVVKYFPGTVRIMLVPRKSVALFLQNANGKAVPAYFDKHGVVFKIGGTRNAFQSVPVFSGLETDRIEEGARLPNAYIPLFENLDKLSVAAPGLYQAISEIHINQRTYDGFDVTLFPS
ncbi:MAG: FtsQ-type POTRA domain-containing protein, partial [Spirochaetaceae bacterium]|nr:FtsQ-type POTRA domain-containing protein [Spirochaetaceae bacterium]